MDSVWVIVRDQNHHLLWRQLVDRDGPDFRDIRHTVEVDLGKGHTITIVPDEEINEMLGPERICSTRWREFS
jgi:hypothetical protein